jgi:hypothetical protein
VVDPVDADASLGQRQRDPPRADRELEGRAIAGELREEVTVGSSTSGSNISADVSS